MDPETIIFTEPVYAIIIIYSNSIPMRFEAAISQMLKLNMYLPRGLPPYRERRFALPTDPESYAGGSVPSW
jgi:hypothetical protein